MKKIYKNKILNVPNTPLFDNTFVFEYFSEKKISSVEMIFLRDLLETKKNTEILQKVSEKPAMWSEVFSPKDELEIFTDLFENALKNNKKIHIVGVTLGEEIKILEEYYESLGFLREDINAFDVDFGKVLVSASCHIENLMWKGSDYKAQKENIFFCPPIREAGQNKALFKGITRGSLAGIDFSYMGKNVGVSLVDTQNEENKIQMQAGQAQDLPLQYREFLAYCIREEKILPLQMGKVLKYNYEDMGCLGETQDLVITY